MVENRPGVPARFSPLQMLERWTDWSHEARLSSATLSVGKRADAQWSVGPRAGTVSVLREVAATPPATLLWVGLNLKIRKIPALVDTGAQFSCVRSEVIDYLYHRGERCTFAPCTMSCFLADGSKAQVSDAVRLHVRLLSFSWDHNFKVLNGGPFPTILGIDFFGTGQNDSGFVL